MFWLIVDLQFLTFVVSKAYVEMMKEKLSTHNSAMDATVESILPGIQQRMASTDSSLQELKQAMEKGFEAQQVKFEEVSTSIQRMELATEDNKKAMAAICLQIASQVLGKNIRISVDGGASNDEAGS